MRRKVIPCFFALVCGILLVYVLSDYFGFFDSESFSMSRSDTEQSFAGGSRASVVLTGIKTFALVCILLTAVYVLYKQKYKLVVFFFFMLGCFVMLNALATSCERVQQLFSESDTTTGKQYQSTLGDSSKNSTKENNEDSFTKEITLTGTVTAIQKKDEDYYRIEIEHSLGKTMASYYQDLESKFNGGQAGKTESSNGSRYLRLLGYTVKAKGIISLPKPQTNPGCFDYRMYLRTKKTDTVMTCSALDVMHIGDRVSNVLGGVRAEFETALCSSSREDKECQIITAMLFGDKSQLDDDMYESFQKNGTAHILAVSGLHIGMIYSLLVLAIGGRRKIKTNITIGLLLIMYAALAGFSPSVVRAVMMIILHIIARLSHRRYDIVSAASFTAGAMLVWNPYQLFSAGFQMSFLAVLILGFALPVFDKDVLIARGNDPLKGFGRDSKTGENTRDDKLKNLKRVLMAPLIIQIGMAPLSAYLFNYISFAGILANVPVVFLAGMIVPLGVVCLILSTILPLPMGICYTAMDLMTRLMIKMNDMFYLGGRTSFDVDSPPVAIVFIFYITGFFVFSEWSRIMWHRKLYRQWMSAALALIFICVIAGSIFGNDFKDCECVFVDVGQGSCIHMRTLGGSDYLFDGGGKPDFGANKEQGRKGFDVGEKILRPYLLKNGVRKVDVAFVTHLDADHYKGIASICKLGMVKKLAVHECLRAEEDRIMKDTGMDRKDIAYLSTGQVIKAKGFKMKILAPATGDVTQSSGLESSGSSGSNSENENSMVAKAVWKDLSVLITGDIDEETERGIVAESEPENLDVDVIAVPHHGSRYGSTDELIKAASPKAAVIQVGKNNYGHPAPEVIERYEDAGVKVLRNDILGAVGVLGNRVKVMQHSKVSEGQK